MSENEKKIIKSDYVTGSYFNIMDYMIRTTVRGMVNTAVPVVVTAVETTGTNSGAGYVSAKPLLMARDGYNNGLPNVDIPKLLFLLRPTVRILTERQRKRYRRHTGSMICQTAFI